VKWTELYGRELECVRLTISNCSRHGMFADLFGYDAQGNGRGLLLAVPESQAPPESAAAATALGGSTLHNPILLRRAAGEVHGAPNGTVTVHRFLAAHLLDGQVIPQPLQQLVAWYSNGQLEPLRPGRRQRGPGGDAALAPPRVQRPPMYDMVLGGMNSILDGLAGIREELVRDRAVP
jgi:hypothetical protein